MSLFVPGGPARYDHQKQGLNTMIRTRGVTALLWDPGTGKTATVIDFASILALKSPQREARILVVAPLAAVDTWVIQAELFRSRSVMLWAEAIGGSIPDRAEALAARGGNPFRGTPDMGPRGQVIGHRAQHYHRALAMYSDGFPLQGPDGLGTHTPRLVIEVINLDTLQSRALMPGRKAQTKDTRLLQAVQRFQPDLVVVDESHKIKGVKANASLLLAKIAKFVPRRMILTGTLMPHSPMDIYGQWRFLDNMTFSVVKNGVHTLMSFADFKNRYAVMGGFYGKEYKSFTDLPDLRAKIGPYTSVVRKADALDLPPTTEVIVPVNLSPAEEKAYSQMKEHLVADLLWGQATVGRGGKLTQMLRLRQITSGHLPVDDGPTEVIGDSKVQSIRSLVYDSLTGEKRIVVFCYFAHEVNALAKALKHRRGEPDTQVMVISGATPAKQRVAMRQRFGPDSEVPDQRIVLVAQIKTLSLAVNELVTANHAIFGSLSQQRDDHIQAEDRLDRTGQTRPVTFWYVLAPGTVDEVIMKSHRARSNLEADMLRHLAEGEEDD